MNEGFTPDMESIDNIMKQIHSTWCVYCHSCGTKREPNDLKFLKKIGKMYYFVSQCPYCGMKNFLVYAHNVGVQVNQVVSDLSVDEMDKFLSPISTDDYLYFYKEFNRVNTLDDLLSFFNPK